MKNQERLDIRITDPFLIEILKNGKKNGTPYPSQINFFFEHTNEKGLERYLHDLGYWARSTSFTPSFPSLIAVFGNFLMNEGIKLSEKRCKMVLQDLEDLYRKHAGEINTERTGMTVQLMNKAKERAKGTISDEGQG